MEILHVLYPGKWTIHAELNDKKEPHRLESLEDPGTKQKEFAVRYDLIFKSTADPDKTIAVLEYKRRGLIRYNDFELAIVSNNASLNEIGLRKEKASTGNLLKTNGISYCKQVCLYAQISECKHVALFNWQHLLLFDFHQLNTGGDKAYTAGEEAKITWVHEDHTRGFMERALIRKTLLGWLLKAFEDFESQ
ncbi:uncharacterized protein J4E87_001616 [Alternaria ethzedia]|uniref:uncharacterized protein n=1 Tax=Alternaria ethzedia TaxID=181014 RepID=UPI0020C212AE|nr:uncharacterized protein J4E87_001616 [Alternaria ethzedia]KAI4632145.1 hypothetical protein J4E87_001616 [Alternaria ethzedia]